jgi:hypothetical protein
MTERTVLSERPVEIKPTKVITLALALASQLRTEPTQLDPAALERGAAQLRCAGNEGLLVSCPGLSLASCSVCPLRSPLSALRSLSLPSPISCPTKQKGNGQRKRQLPDGGGSMIWIHSVSKRRRAESTTTMTKPLRRRHLASFSTRTRPFAWCGTCWSCYF